MTEDAKWLATAYGHSVFFVVAVGAKIFAEKEQDQYAIYVFVDQTDAALYAMTVDSSPDTPFRILATGLKSIWRCYQSLVDDAGAASVVLASCTAKGDLEERDTLFSDRLQEAH